MPRHWLFVTGGACLIAAIAIVGVSMGSAQNATATIGEPTADPTIDPCVEITQIESVGSDVSALQSEEECETPTETIPRTHTPTPEGTEPATEVADTSTPAPTEPPATDTPTGGAGAGGVQPPSTGFGPDGGNGGGLWLLLAGAALAAVGAGATVAGIRSR
jgi:hypothetical protein